MGAWPLLLALISIDCARTPDEERRLLCFPVKCKYYPWILAVAFTLFSGLTFDVILGAIFGHAYVLGYIDFVKLKASTSASWEGGWAASVAALQGFVPAASASPEGVSGATQQAAGWSRDNRTPAVTANGNGTSMLAGSGSGGATAPHASPAPTFPGGGRALGASSPAATSAAAAGGGPQSSSSAREKRASAAAAAAARATAAKPSTPAASASTPAPASSTALLHVPEEELSLLEAMGYDREQAKQAMLAANGDVEAAMASLEEAA